MFHPSAESELRLVCFPHAGGSASYFFPWSQALAPGIETLALQYPGRQDRRADPRPGSVAELADQVFAALEGLAGGTFAFFGHSMGSVLAFEVARRFEDRTGGGPAHLVASGYPAPSRLRGGDVHLRGDAGIVEELLASGGSDPRGLRDEDMLAMILPPVRDDYRLIENHPPVPDAVLKCPITMLTGDADHHTTREEAAAWRDHTAGEFRLRVFSGGHFFIDPHRDAVLGEISAALKGIAYSSSGTSEEQ
ncbi:thioesterase II family protein [Actinomadura rubrisoli]|uniref:thioesterase II family protein n=1 Tax=Actinomadura rubrisoli TaxID=2530368 RepID=UPI001A9D9507|nr:alpha/beta fold hydrolase [Actinomadura rubrisoli]